MFHSIFLVATGVNAAKYLVEGAVIIEGIEDSELFMYVVTVAIP